MTEIRQFRYYNGVSGDFVTACGTTNNLTGNSRRASTESQRKAKGKPAATGRQVSRMDFCEIHHFFSLITKPLLTSLYEDRRRLQK